MISMVPLRSSTLVKAIMVLERVVMNLLLMTAHTMFTRLPS